MIKIVKANIDQVELIAKIGKQTFLESHGHCASVEDVREFVLKTYNEKVIIKEFDNPNVQYHIIYFKNKAVGFSKIELDSPHKNIHDLNVAKLDRLYVLEEYYGKNIGSKLFDFNIQLSKKFHQKGIWLATWVENQRAINFYTKNGFKIVGEYHFKISETHSNPNHIMFLDFINLS